MQHQEYAPPEALQDIIRCFWYDQKNFGALPTAFEVLPDGYAELIFYFGSGCSVSRNGRLQSLPSPFLVGLLHRPVAFYAQDRLEIIGIRCFPWTVFDLLGLPAGKDGIRLFDEHPVARLQSVLSPLVQAERIREALDKIAQHFLAVRSQATIDPVLRSAGAAMQEAAGALPVHRVAAAAHATVRTLERKFSQSSGHSVKDVCGLMRFEQVRNRLRLYPDTNLAGLAQELGYADQSHLSRVFKRYTGTTPAAFARSVKQNVRADSDGFVAFVQA